MSAALEESQRMPPVQNHASRRFKFGYRYRECPARIRLRMYRDTFAQGDLAVDLLYCVVPSSEFSGVSKQGPDAFWCCANKNSDREGFP